MHSTKDATIQLIQREISEVVQREKELKEIYSKSNSPSECPKKVTTNGFAKSNTAPTNGISHSPKSNRLFTQNPSTKGAMLRFIKSRGKVSNISPTYGSKNNVSSWSRPDNIELGKPIIPVGVKPRNGFVPINERIRKEFQEMEQRESELFMQRTKSQPDLLVLFNSHSPEPLSPLQSTRSISQLSDSTNDSMRSPSPSLKPARSLADLCDVDDEESTPPGSVSLIRRWEGIIGKNQHS